MEMTQQAKTLWDKIPAQIRVKLLNNVYCGKCGDNRSVGQASAVVEKGDIIIRGICTTCSSPVARLIEAS